MASNLHASATPFDVLITQCTTECQTVFQTQQNPPSDWSTTCTPTFASAVQSCLNCISTTVPALLLTDDVKKGISATLEIYQKNCLTLASTTEPVTLPTALSVSLLSPALFFRPEVPRVYRHAIEVGLLTPRFLRQATGTQSGGTSPRSSLTGSGTASSTPASATSGAAANMKVQTPGFTLAAALVVAFAAL